ncbi:FAD-dependent monooxygenase [Gordonia hydrophobica]|uniref:FAD-dependent monooxygenase n=1 Tax=Gordonia hydrophobica TaxID=40516 RepID=A0ABZ2U1C6_9ACTN|nr:FAD-dependent monooxygenase [Gordonia hydrophobica]MBM7368449.1 2-polyprenyl-6-methoxyphenol hydroxylase-like FAD-dependent oxidoreductase [Gordonia hydrophobica]
MVVAGAGVAGLTVAAGLVRTGHEVSVVERRTDTTSGAGISLWPNALAALDTLGLGDPVRDASARISGGAMRWRDGTWFRRPGAQALTAALGEPLAVLRRVDLRDVLSAALPLDAVRYGVAAVAGRTVGDRVVVDLSDGTSVEADLLIAADGVGSRLIRMFNAGLVSRYTGYTAWRGIADTAVRADLAGEVFGEAVEVGIVPLPNGHTYWFATRREPEGAVFADELAEVVALARGWPEPIGEVLAATAPEAVSRTDLYDRATARRWSSGRIVGLGDAVHPMRPHLGQGGCQAIEDAAILTAVLNRRASLTDALGDYQQIRTRRVRRVVAESAAIGRAVNARPNAVMGAIIRATRVLPDSVMMGHVAAVAGPDAFTRQWRRIGG